MEKRGFLSGLIGAAISLAVPFIFSWLDFELMSILLDIRLMGPLLLLTVGIGLLTGFDARSAFWQAVACLLGGVVGWLIAMAIAVNL